MLLDPIFCISIISLDFRFSNWDQSWWCFLSKSNVNGPYGNNVIIEVNISTFHFFASSNPVYYTHNPIWAFKFSLNRVIYCLGKISHEFLHLWPFNEPHKSRKTSGLLKISGCNWNGKKVKRWCEIDQKRKQLGIWQLQKK